MRLAIVTLSLFALALFAGSANAGVIAAFDFEDAGNRTKDTSGNGNHASDTAVSYGFDATRGGDVATFNADTGEAFSFPTSGGVSGDWTVAAWIKTDVSTGAYFMDTRDTGGSSTDGPILSVGRNTADTIGFWDGGWKYNVFGPNVRNGAWRHLAWAYDDTADTVSMYVDAALVLSTSVDSGLSLPSTLAIITPGEDGDNLIGSTDEVRVFDTALSASEVNALAFPDVPEPSTAPEPSTFILAAFSLLGVAFVRRPRNR